MTGEFHEQMIKQKKDKIEMKNIIKLIYQLANEN